ncbi:hypothetical protein GCM10008959_38760 [Deinococcus seoulensis]|uniref:Uncharacterized protein n=2 Tax=Deinococcus seoulensis TaxID=1837379 RepID=A0ABQ2RZR3_9DEIO|nr:hypothetical protein GCM10008959_38760 [Deinococcus seoulensis]
MKIRYNLLPIISRDARGEFDELHIVNISSSVLVIADIRRDDKDFNDYIFGIENTLASGNYSYKLLKPGESLIILKKGEIIARPGDTYRFDIGIYYGLAGDSRQNISFKIVFGSSETASISNYSDTNPSRPVEKFTKESEGIYKRSVDSGNLKE